MTEKLQIITAFQYLDFEELNRLLDDNKSYMDVSKRTFLDALKREVEKYEDLKAFDVVVEGVCNYCNKGHKAYKFKANNQPSLNLFFEEKEGRINDIYLCHDLKTNNTNQDDGEIYFWFYEEEKVDFKRTLNYSINLTKIEQALEEFSQLKQFGLVPIQEVIYWFEKLDILIKDLNLNDPFKTKIYKAHKNIESLVYEVSNLVHNYSNKNIAKKALKEYQKLDKTNEKMLVSWLLKHKDNYFYPLKKTDNWEKTGILILETNPNLVLDCSDFLDSFILNEIYDKEYERMVDKYKPAKDHFDQDGQSIHLNLSGLLKLHNKYLDLL